MFRALILPQGVGQRRGVAGKNCDFSASRRTGVLAHARTHGPGMLAHARIEGRAGVLAAACQAMRRSPLLGLAVPGPADAGAPDSHAAAGSGGAAGAAVGSGGDSAPEASSSNRHESTRQMTESEAANMRTAATTGWSVPLTAKPTPTTL